MAVIDTYAPSISPTDSPVQALLKRFESAKSVKDLYKGEFEDCYEFALPQKESFYDETQGRRRTDRIFDDKFVIAVSNPDTKLVEIVENIDHPWFVGVQFHPEYKSSVYNPHPIFVNFVKASLKNYLKS